MWEMLCAPRPTKFLEPISLSLVALEVDPRSQVEILHLKITTTSYLHYLLAQVDLLAWRLLLEVRLARSSRRGRVF